MLGLCGTQAGEWSDAPQSYGVSRHLITEGNALILGNEIDTEYLTNVQSYPDDATGDGNDDDGVTIPVLTLGQTATITAEVTGAGGFLQGWIDFDGNGTFEAGEQVATDLQDDDDNGEISVSVAVPYEAVTTQTFARFRWSTTNGLDAIAAAPDGEVEDYAVTIAAPLAPPVCTILTANGQPTASTASHTILTASSPANQLAWGGALFFGSIEATYEGDFSANSTDFGVINRNWVAGTHANSGNGINYDLNGIYSAVDRIVLLLSLIHI